MIVVRTESGSAYVLDRDDLTWSRFREMPDPAAPFPVRTKTGNLTAFPEIEIGKRLVLMCPPFVEGAIARMITTTPVVEIVER